MSHEIWARAYAEPGLVKWAFERRAVNCPSGLYSSGAGRFNGDC